MDRFSGYSPEESGNGFIILPKYTKSFLSLTVVRETVLGLHIQFLCTPTDGALLPDAEAVTYAYYQKHINPKTKPDKEKDLVCSYVYEESLLPDNDICPICKHGSADFEPI